MDAFGGISAFFEGGGDFVVSLFSADEYDGEIRFLHVEETAEGVEFLSVGKFDVFLLDKVDGDGSRFDFHRFRIF